jgi:hypothetical protein
MVNFRPTREFLFFASESQITWLIEINHEMVAWFVLFKWINVDQSHTADFGPRTKIESLQKGDSF